MKLIKTNRDNSKWIEITKALLLFRPYKRARVHFIFWKSKGLTKFYGFKNCRFSIWKYANYKPMNIKNLRVFIRLPFFYWNKDNSGWEFGLPNFYLWWHEARAN
jgi:hypothetical protein